MKIKILIAKLFSLNLFLCINYCFLKSRKTFRYCFSSNKKRNKTICYIISLKSYEVITSNSLIDFNLNDIIIFKIDGPTEHLKKIIYDNENISNKELSKIGIDCIYKKKFLKDKIENNKIGTPEFLIWQNENDENTILRISLILNGKNYQELGFIYDEKELFHFANFEEFSLSNAVYEILINEWERRSN